MFLPVVLCGSVRTAASAPTAPPSFTASRLAVSIEYLRYNGALWQDTAQTVPATADGDPVRRMVVSSANYDAPSDAARPLLRSVSGKWCLYGDGVDDQLVGQASLTWSGGGLTVMDATELVTDTTAYSMLAATGLSAASWNRRWPQTSGRPSLAGGSHNTGGGEASAVPAGTTISQVGAGPQVVSGRQAADGTWTLRQAGTLRDTRTTGLLAAGSVGVVLFNRAAGDFFANAKMYGLIVCDTDLSDADILAGETYLATLLP